MVHRPDDLDGHDAYQLLGVKESASAAEIRRGYLRAMRIEHPDRSGSAEQAKLINCARDILLHERAYYDSYRRSQAQRLAQEVEERLRAAQSGLGGPGRFAAASRAGAAASRAGAVPRPAGGQRTGAGGKRAGAAPRAGASEGLSPEQVPVSLSGPGGWLATLLLAPLLRSWVSPRTYAGLIVVLIFGLVLATTNGGQHRIGIGSEDQYSPSETAPFGVHHSCTIHSDGSLWCQGNNDQGQLGKGDFEQYAGPVRVGKAHWRSVSTAVWHTCAIRSDQSLWCWGDNTNGDLGVDTADVGQGYDFNTPQPVNDRGQWLSLATSYVLTCAVRADHTLWCWGDAGVSYVNDPPGYSRIPLRYGPEADWAQVQVAGDQLCPVRTDGTSLCWDVS